MTLAEYLDVHPELNRSAFARSLGMHRTALYNLARGYYRPSLRTALLIEVKTNGAVSPRDWEKNDASTG